MTPSTIPMFVLGFTNRSLILFIVGMAVLALYIIVGTKQLNSMKKEESNRT
jgi:hypothetical protein